MLSTFVSFVVQRANAVNAVEQTHIAVNASPLNFIVLPFHLYCVFNFNRVI